MTDAPGSIPHLDEEAEEKAIDVSDVRLLDAPGLLLFWALAFVVFLQFFSRYVMNSSIGWTEEIARYLLIGVTFVGCVTVTRKGTHIAVEVLDAYLHPVAARTLRRVIDFLLVAIYAWLAWVCMKLAQRTPGMMVSIDVPKSVTYWVVAVSMAVMAVHQLLHALRGRRA
jgi:TRAP-type C4-dicarboxylate transport system permease small subunit